MKWIKASERIWEYGVPVIVRCLGEVSIERYHNIIEVMPKNLIEWLDESEPNEPSIDDELQYLKEGIQCVHQYLDDLKIPRELNEGNLYSIVGRIGLLEIAYMEKLSNLESHYLNKPEPSIQDDSLDIFLEKEYQKKLKTQPQPLQEDGVEDKIQVTWEENMK